jgi:hypothetical protein
MKRILSFLFIAVLACVVPLANANSKPSSIAPVAQHEAMIIYPILARDKLTSNFLTLGEGLKSRTVRVIENRQGQVGLVTVVNNSIRPLFILGGEIIRGGYQDRMFSDDAVVAARSRADIPVYCVERSRWGGTYEFASPVVVDMRGRITEGAIAPPFVRESAAVKKNQTVVWGDVAKANGTAAIDVSTSELTADIATSATSDNFVTGTIPVDMTRTLVVTGSPSGTWTLADISEGEGAITYSPPANVSTSLLEAYSQPSLHEEFKAFESQVDWRDYPDAAGMIVTMNGKVVLAERFASSQLFTKYRTRLLKAAFIEAKRTPMKELTEFLGLTDEDTQELFRRWREDSPHYRENKSLRCNTRYCVEKSRNTAYTTVTLTQPTRARPVHEVSFNTAD